ncbi:MAG: DNA polymerase III subunit beta [Alphaproteobacteria bacterium]|nr:DNA polymerase III subunit beta [Alphaproteobacteria bacterium]
MTPKAVERIFKVPLAAADDPKSQRFMLRGVNVQRTDNGVVAVGTDGHRLHRTETITEVTGDLNAIVPRRAAERILALEPNRMRIDGRVVDVVTDNGTRYVSKLVDSLYPDTNHIIPAPGANRAEVNRNAFVAALTRVGAMARDDDEKGTPAIVISWGPDLNIATPDEDDRGATETVEAKTAGSAKYAVGYRLLLDAVRATDADTIALDVGAVGTATRVTVPADPGLLALVMPRRIPGLATEVAA